MSVELRTTEPACFPTGLKTLLFQSPLWTVAIKSTTRSTSTIQCYAVFPCGIKVRFLRQDSTLHTLTVFDFDCSSFIVNFRRRILTGWYNFSLSFLSTMESTNRDITIHRTTDPDQNLLLGQHWEIIDPILSCTNQELLHFFCLNQPNEIIHRFKGWESGLPLCIVPQVFHFRELIEWYVVHYSNETKSIVNYKSSQIFITISSKEVIKMLGLHSTSFQEQNTVTLSEETLVQKFTSLSPQDQFTFVHSIQKPKILLQVLNYPLKSDLFQTPIQLILSMYTQVMGLNHDQGIT